MVRIERRGPAVSRRARRRGGGFCRNASARASRGGFEQYAAALRSVCGRRGQGAHHWRKSPFLHVRLDKDKTGLPEVDVDAAGTVRADGREHVSLVEADIGVLELFAVPGEEDRSGSRAVTDAERVPLEQRGTVRSRGEREGVRLEAVFRVVADGVAADA